MERRGPSQKPGFVVAAGAHALALFFLVWSFEFPPPLDPTVESVPVEMVTTDDLNQIMNGEKNAKPMDHAQRRVDKLAELEDHKDLAPTPDARKDTPPDPTPDKAVPDPGQAEKAEPKPPEPAPAPTAALPTPSPVAPPPPPPPTPPVPMPPERPVEKVETPPPAAAPLPPARPVEKAEAPPPEDKPLPPPDAEPVAPAPPPRPKIEAKPKVETPKKQEAKKPMPHPRPTKLAKIDPPKVEPAKVEPPPPPPRPTPKAEPKLFDQVTDVLNKMKPDKPFDRMASLIDKLKPDLTRPAPPKPEPPKVEPPKPVERPRSGNEVKDAKKRDDFNPDKITAMLSHEAPQRQASTGRALAQTASLGSPTAHADKMTPTLQAQINGWFIDHYNACWHYFGLGAGSYVPLVRVVVKPDGSLMAKPSLLNPTNDPNLRSLAESAVRAVHECDPLPIPDWIKPHYATWRDHTIKFDLANKT